MLPKKTNDVFKNEKAISNLVEAIMDTEKPRLITLLGHPGVGKSTVANYAMHYVLERRYFSGGVILVNLQQVRHFNTIERKMKKVIISSLNLKFGELRTRIEKAKDDVICEYIVDFFQQRNDDFKLTNQSAKNSTGKLNFVLCFDNVEELITNEGEKFRKFLAVILNDCPNLRIVVTSSKALTGPNTGVIPNGIQTEQQILKNLSAKNSVNLFTQHSGEIYADDIYQLILEDENYPIEKLMPNMKTLQRPVNDSVRDEIMQVLDSTPYKMEKALSIHDMFKQLSGNPMSIKILASFHANTLIKKNDLKSIYEKVKSEKSFMDENHNNKGTSQINNLMSLRISTETSVQLL